jgi:cell division protein FtsQ
MPVRAERPRMIERFTAGVPVRTAGAGLLLVAVVLAAVLGLDYVLRATTFPVRSVSFEGEFKHVDQQQLADALVKLVSGNIFLLDLDAIKARAEGVPWVHQASVRRRWPDGVHIRFTEQVLVARWGARAWVNADGEAVDLQGRPGVDGLPQLDGPPGMQYGVLEHYRGLSSILAPAGLRVVELRLSARRTWEILLDNGVALVVGKEEPEAKVARFARLYPTALAARSEQIKQVDLRYSNGFAVEWLSGDTQAVTPRPGRG